MRLTVLGSSGSVPAPNSPASGYLIESEGSDNIIMDLGPGTLAKLQEVASPGSAHVMFSHLHADHCMDFPSLVVWDRYHPSLRSQQPHQLLGPSRTVVHLGALSSDNPEAIDEMADIFNFTAFQHGVPVEFNDYRVTPYSVIHPVEAYGLRVEHKPSGFVIAYSGDSSDTPNLIETARGADLFLCEATWCETSEGKAPNMHMSGAEAGTIAAKAGAKELVLVHIPPWGDVEATIAAARSEFDGPISAATPGRVYQLA